MLKRSQLNIYDRWYEQSGKAKVLEAQRVKNKNLEKRRPKLKNQECAGSKKMQQWDSAPLCGPKKATESLTFVKKNVAGGDANSAFEDHVSGLRSRAKTRYNCLFRQKLMQDRMKLAMENWIVGGTGVNITPMLRLRAADRRKKSSDADTVVSDAQNWAACGTWPSRFSDVLAGGHFSIRKTSEVGSAVVGRSNQGLYERWFVSHRDSIAEAKQKLKQLKRSRDAFFGSCNALNAHKLKEVFERNHLDDYQDAIQGKKFTYEWILEQESLIEKRLANIRADLAPEDIDHDTWKYADCINTVHPWEEAVEFEFDDCS
ncbi:Hypothetical predicted protein [Cloeon dipterum]|uniref:Uncharacterized protein n=1 Tax=Cloeon dipterum TaxID=197152 RepID=A0A8S1BZ39_9INSE|nr:Hypothetical predicted protein [Cloeon dipterum]